MAMVLAWFVSMYTGLELLAEIGWYEFFSEAFPPI